MTVGRSRRARAAVRRTRRLGRVLHDLTDAQWAALTAAWGGCAYCGTTDVPLQRDCILPIARGGRYTLVNVVPACGSCNASKCSDEVTGWLRRKRLDERTFLMRHLEIGRLLTSTLDTSDHDPGVGSGVASDLRCRPKNVRIRVRASAAASGS